LDFSSEVKGALGVLLRESQDKALKHERFTEALEWTIKLKSIEDSETFLKNWSDAILVLLSQYKEQKQGLNELVHQVFVWTNPDPTLWKTYILLALTHAPVSVLEKILELLPDSEFIEPLLKRLEDLDSKKFLEPTTWWPEVWKKMEHKPESIKRGLAYRLITGASNAYDYDRNKVSGINEVLKILESDAVCSFLSFQEKMFTCPLRVEFARLLWFSEIKEQKTKALLTLYQTFLLVGDDPFVEKHAIYLVNSILKTMPEYKSRDDIHTALLLIQRVHESGSRKFADHVAILRFLKKVSIESDAKNTNKEEKEFFENIAVCLLFYIDINVKDVLSRSIEDSKIQPKEKSLVKWGITRLYDSGLLWGFDLAAWCLENPYIAAYLSEEEIKKLKDYKDALRGGCGVIIKALHAWDDVKRCNISVISPFKRCVYLSSHGLKDQFQLQSGERKELEKTVWKTATVIGQLSLLVVIIGHVALLILKVYNHSTGRYPK
jgi:hypothetical protein